MIVVLKPEATKEDADGILNEIERMGLKPLFMPGAERIVLGALGDERVLAGLHLDSHPMVESVKPVLAPYKLVSREWRHHDTIVDIDGVKVGGGSFVVIAGPCAVESLEQMTETARRACAAGPTSRAPAHMRSRAWASRDSKSSNGFPSNSARRR
jgi:3-deoxy-7-phosphoheptulonate synthase